MHRQWFDALDHETQADFAEPPPEPTEPAAYALAPNWRWTRTLHLFRDHETTRCGRPVAARVAAETVRQVLGQRAADRVCGSCTGAKIS